MKKFLAKYYAFLWLILDRLGAWGLFTIAAVDSTFFGLPMDLVVGTYVARDPRHFWLHSIVASAGSALGSLIPYWIGYTGGEKLVAKRIGRERFNRIHGWFERHEAMALAVPAMLPPPTPFKAFVLTAAVFEMRLRDFLAAIFIGRLVRFCVLSMLVIGLLDPVKHLFQQHLWAALITIAVVAILGYIVWRIWRSPGRVLAGESNDVED